MGWRFRQSFKLIPGVKLNLSKSGLSCSVGGAPFTFNVGNKGVMLTGSVPGTGISYRQHFGLGQTQHHPGSPTPDSFPPPAVPAPSTLLPDTSTAPVEEIHSASTEVLTSDSLKELKGVLQTAYQEHEDISRQLDTARNEKQRASDRYSSWEGGFLFKRMFEKNFAQRKADSETAVAKVDELEQQLRLTTIATHVEIAKEQAEPYFKMRDAFASLCECAAIWDVKSRQATDKLRERTTASHHLDRQKVLFSLGSCDLIQWEQPVPHLQNAYGGDIFLYPGFILYRAAKEAFSVIDFHDLKGGKAELTRFYEESGVPSDSKVIGQTWAKCNKDGSRDKRFQNNYQIPIAAYALWSLKTTAGLWEEFLLSNPERLKTFIEAWNGFGSSFAAGCFQDRSDKVKLNGSLVEDNGTTGVVKGILTNAAGSIMAGVKLSLKNKNTGKVHTTITGTKGEYEFRGLGSGGYDILMDDGDLTP